MKIHNSGIEKVRNNAAVAVEVVVTATPSFFAKDKEELCDYKTNFDHPKFNAWYNSSVAWLKSEFGDLLMHADLHMDETTPHIHAFFVPIVKLQKSVHVSYKKFEKQTMLCLSASKLINKRWSFDLHDSYANAMAPLGLVRGNRGVQQTHSKLKDYRITEHEIERNQKKLTQLRNEFMNEVQEHEEFKLKVEAIKAEYQEYVTKLARLKNKEAIARRGVSDTIQKFNVVRRKAQEVKRRNNELVEEHNSLNTLVDNAKREKAIAVVESKEAKENCQRQLKKLKHAVQSGKSIIEFYNGASGLVRQFSAVGANFENQIRGSYILEAASQEYEDILNKMRNITERYLASTGSRSAGSDRNFSNASPNAHSPGREPASNPKDNSWLLPRRD